jgi:hypothetical protein
MRWVKVFAKFFLSSLALAALMAGQALGHGFNADKVKILYVPADNLYRITIRYTNIEVGEYREAIIHYRNRTEALKVYWDLVNGADFFLGNVKESVHFHENVPKNNPY